MGKSTEPRNPNERVICWRRGKGRQHYPPSYKETAAPVSASNARNFLLRGLLIRPGINELAHALVEETVVGGGETNSAQPKHSTRLAALRITVAPVKCANNLLRKCKNFSPGLAREWEQHSETIILRHASRNARWIHAALPSWTFRDCGHSSSSSLSSLPTSSFLLSLFLLPLPPSPTTSDFSAVRFYFTRVCLFQPKNHPND